MPLPVPRLQVLQAEDEVGIVDVRKVSAVLVQATGAHDCAHFGRYYLLWYYRTYDSSMLGEDVSEEILVVMRRVDKRLFPGLQE